MKGQSGLSELSILSWVPAVEGCLLSGIPLYYYKLPYIKDLMHEACWFAHKQYR